MYTNISMKLKILQHEHIKTADGKLNAYGGFAPAYSRCNVRGLGRGSDSRRLIKLGILENCNSPYLHACLNLKSSSEYKSLWKRNSSSSCCWNLSMVTKFRNLKILYNDSVFSLSIHSLTLLTSAVHWFVVLILYRHIPWLLPCLSRMKVYIDRFFVEVFFPSFVAFYNLLQILAIEDRDP